MKIKTHIVVTIIAFGHLALPVATTHAGGITPVPKLVFVTESGALLATNAGGSLTVVYDDARRIAGVDPRMKFRDLAIEPNADGRVHPDLAGSKIYIADAGMCNGGSGRIVRVGITPRAMGQPTPDTFAVLFAELNCPTGVAFDEDSGYLYWSDREDGTVYRSQVTNPACQREDDDEEPRVCTMEPILCGLESPENVRICSAEEGTCGTPGEIYWTETNGNAGSGTIRRASLIDLVVCTPPTPGNITVIVVVEGLHTPVGLSIGRDNIFWTDTGTNTIGSASLFGVKQTGMEIANTFTDSLGIGLAFPRGQGRAPDRMFWTIPDDMGNGPKIKMRAPNDMKNNGTDVNVPSPGPVTGIRVLGPPIPTISTWGAVVMLLLVLAGGSIAFRDIRASTS